MSEVWKSLAGYEGFYEISSHGNIKSLDRLILDSNGGRKRKFEGRMLAQNFNKAGYKQVGLCKSGSKAKKDVHRLVAEHFVENVNGGLCVNHLDGDKTNNTITNLEWCTQKDNMRHAYRKGLVNGRHIDRRVVSPSGQVFFFRSTEEFCRLQGIPISSDLIAVMNGRRKSCRGWTQAAQCRYEMEREFDDE